MRKRSLFRWSRHFIILTIVCITVQAWLLDGYSPWMNIHPANNEIVESRFVPLHRPAFQTGIDFPQWGKSGYGTLDRNWQTGLRNITYETAAQWVAMDINFTQPSPGATTVQITRSTPDPEAVAQGIQLAHAMGFHVYIQPLITVTSPVAWAGFIQFTTEQQAQAWFDSYWQAYEPYITVAASAGAEELSLGDEYEHLQSSWTTQWNQLIARTYTTFHGTLTYNMNWTSLSAPIPTWMQNPLLGYIGVAVYIPLINTPERIAPTLIPALWRKKVGIALDNFSIRIKKPLLISEIGYRNSPDALYNPWANQTLPGTDPVEQAAAYDAALQNVLVDPHIIGIFFWAWSFPPYQPNEEPAAQVLYHWYTSLSV